MDDIKSKVYDILESNSKDHDDANARANNSTGHEKEEGSIVAQRRKLPTGQKMYDRGQDNLSEEELDRHGRKKVARWGSDDEKEEGTVKSQLRKLPPKRKYSK